MRKLLCPDRKLLTKYTVMKKQGTENYVYYASIYVNKGGNIIQVFACDCIHHIQKDVPEFHNISWLLRWDLGWEEK